MGHRDDYYLVSLDVETTGTDPSRHTILSAAMVDLETKDHIYVEFDHEEILLSLEAIRINQIDLRRKPESSEALLPIQEAISKLDNWLWIRRPKDDTGRPVPARALGKQPWFDTAFLKPIWVASAMVGVVHSNRFPFQYRGVDLNSLYSAIARIEGRLTADVRRGIEGGARLALPAQVRALKLHDALFDAFENVAAWELCLERLRKGKDS